MPDEDFAKASLAQSMACDWEDLGRVQARVRSFLKESGLPKPVAYNCVLVLEEILTNVIRHAHDDSSGHEVRLCVEVRQEGVEMTFADDGRPFDPATAALPDLNLPIEERPLGGMGLTLVRNACSSMNYRRDQGRNFLSLRVDGGGRG